MTPFLLLPARDYTASLIQAAKMMANRGFDTQGGGELPESERERAAQYIKRAYAYVFNGLFPFVTRQLEGLASLQSPNAGLYRNCLRAVGEAASVLRNPDFRRIVDEDPRHLFLLASSRKYPHSFSGYQGGSLDVPPSWQQAACSLLKMCHLIKSVEEDSQDINDYAQLGFFLETQGQSLDDLITVIERSVAHGDQLDVCECLGANAPNGGGEIPPAVSVRQDDRDGGSPHRRRS